MKVYAFIDDQKTDFAIETLCKVTGVSRSAFYEWVARRHSGPSPTAEAEAVLVEQIRRIHRRSRSAYGAPRVVAQLAKQHVVVNHKRVERLMRQAHIRGIYRGRAQHGCTRRDLNAVPSDDLVGRQFDPDQPDRLWVMDVTEHPTREGKVYLAAVLDAYSRRVVGWSIADHIRAELVVDALQMAIWRRQPPKDQTIAHSDHGSQTRLNPS